MIPFGDFEGEETSRYSLIGKLGLNIEEIETDHIVELPVAPKHVGLVPLEQYKSQPTFPQFFSQGVVIGDPPSRGGEPA